MNAAALQLYNLFTPTDDELTQRIGSGVVYGTVLSIQPLTIETDGRIVLSENFLIVSALCKQYIRTYDTHWYPSENPPTEAPLEGDHNHKIEIEFWRGLQVGDKVNLIMSSDKQHYYVIERQGMEGTVNNVTTS